MQSTGSLVWIGIGVLLAVLGIIGSIIGFQQIGDLGNVRVLMNLAMIFLGGVFLFIGLLLRRKRFEQSMIQDPIWEKTGTFQLNEVQSLDFSGTPVQFQYVPPKQSGKQKEPSRLVISSSRADRADPRMGFTIVREIWFDRLCKSLRIASEVQTGDRAFDELLYIRTDCPEFCKAYLRDALKRRAMITLFESGFNSVQLTESSLEATWQGFHPERDMKANLFESSGQALATLSQELPTTKYPIHSTRNLAITFGIFMVVELIGFLFLFSFIAYPVLRAGKLFGTSLSYTIPAWLILVWISAWLLRGHSTSHHRWIMVVVVGLFSCVLGGFGICGLINGMADRSPLEKRIAPIVHKSTSRSKNSTTYRIEFPSKTQPGETERVTVTRAEYEQIVLDHSQIEIESHAGALGAEWIVRKQVHIHPIK